MIRQPMLQLVFCITTSSPRPHLDIFFTAAASFTVASTWMYALRSSLATEDRSGVWMSAAARPHSAPACRYGRAKRAPGGWCEGWAPVVLGGDACSNRDSMLMAGLG